MESNLGLALVVTSNSSKLSAAAGEGHTAGVFLL